jgi:hypothetical protein
MAFTEDTARRPRAAADPSGDDGWDRVPAPQRDWKKTVLVAGLGVLSWVATYIGMLELIEANMGELPLVHKAVIAFSVGMLMIMIIWLLDQLFSPISLVTRTLYLAGYLFLTVISVGFGFGFYWKVLESRSEASRSAESAGGQVQGSLLAASSRLEQLQGTLDTLTNISRQKAQLETQTGTSCPNSRPGEGPRRKLRDDDAARFQFASEFVKGRVGQVRTEMAAIETDLGRIGSNDASLIDKAGTRNEFLKGLNRRLDNTVTGFNAFRSDPQLRQIRQDLAERADRTSFPDSKGGSFQCPDTQLQAALKGVVRAIDELPVLEKPKVAAVEGSEATIEAFRRLTATMQGLLTFKLPPSADELRDLQRKAVQSVEPQAAAARPLHSGEQPGLSRRDYIPLAIAIFVDVCLLLVSIGRPINRMQSLVPRMRAAEQGPVYRILSRFSDIHKDAETRERFDLFRHVVFDFNGDYYVAVPLDAPYNYRPKGASAQNERYTRQIEELRLEASMLANLFASFEKEKIFSRVYNPLLSTKSIQRKLWRQGSKFAASEAFRVYRFRDGAWSEFILGAVMGAARRMDEERRRRERAGERDGRQTDEEARARTAAPATEPAARARPAPRAEEPVATDRGDEQATRQPREAFVAFPGSGAPHGRVSGSTGQAAHGPATANEEASEHQAAFGPYARHVRPEPVVPRASRPPADEPLVLPRVVTEPPRRPLDRIKQAARAPRVSEFMSEVDVTAANANTAPDQGSADRLGLGASSSSDNVLAMPAPRQLQAERSAEIAAVVAPAVAAAIAAQPMTDGNAALAIATSAPAPAVAPAAAIATAEPIAPATPVVEVSARERLLTFTLPAMAAGLPQSVAGQVGTSDVDLAIARLGAVLAALPTDEGSAGSLAITHDPPAAAAAAPQEAGLAGA